MIGELGADFIKEKHEKGTGEENSKPEHEEL